MALISRKKNITKAPEKKSSNEKVESKDNKLVAISTAHILLHPRVTEKASEKSMNENIYVFDVLKSVTKRDVKQAVLEMYKVHPTKIAIVKVPQKKVFVRGRYGTRGSGKKAYVYLKKGDKIEIV